MTTKHHHVSTRVTGNEDAAGIDPGGTRSTRPGHRAGDDPSGKAEAVIEQDIESGDRNVNPDLMQRLPHGQVVTENGE